MPVVSPDGRMLALPLETPEGKALYLRPLNSFDLIRIEGGRTTAVLFPRWRVAGFHEIRVDLEDEPGRTTAQPGGSAG